MKTFSQFIIEEASPAEVKALTSKVNDVLTDKLKVFQAHVPLDTIMKVLSDNGLDPKSIKSAFNHPDHGRMHVPVGMGVYFVMTWYALENGKFEIVAYVTSQHDDLKVVAKPMDAGQRKKAMATANDILAKVGLKYWDGMGAASKAVSDAIEANGFDADEFHDEVTKTTGGKTEGRVHVPVGNGVYVAMTYTKMPVTGKYEIVAYLS